MTIAYYAGTANKLRTFKYSSLQSRTPMMSILQAATRLRGIFSARPCRPGGTAITAPSPPFAAWADPTSFRNVNEVSESGDTVTFTFDLHNGTYGTSVPYTATFTVDSGIITSSTSHEN